MTTLSELSGTRWKGAAELWLDPLGDRASRSECTMEVDSGGVRYTWSHEGAAHEGSITLSERGADFQDSWHQKQPMACARVKANGALFQVQGSYGPDGDWGWRIGLSLRAPTGELVLQMTNITSWGEEARAVRMICARES
jgi:hypothetical protein